MGRNNGWKFLPQVASGLPGKKGRNNLPLEPSGADPLSLHCAGPQNNPSRIPFSAPREKSSESLRRPNPDLSITCGSFVGKKLPLENPRNCLIAFSRLHPWTHAWTKTPKQRIARFQIMPQYLIVGVAFVPQISSAGASWMHMDNVLFLQYFHGRAWTNHGRTWMKGHGRIQNHQ